MALATAEFKRLERNGDYCYSDVAGNVDLRKATAGVWDAFMETSSNGAVRLRCPETFSYVDWEHAPLCRDNQHIWLTVELKSWLAADSTAA